MICVILQNTFRMNQNLTIRSNSVLFQSNLYYNIFVKTTYDRINLQIRKDGAQGLKVADMKDYAKDSDKSLNEWIIDAIKYYIEHEY